MTDARAQSPADPNTVALANAVLDAMDLEGRYDRLVPRMQIANDAVADAALKSILIFNKKYVGPTQLRPLLADAYAKLFTMQELHDLVTWYASPLGRKLEETIPALVAARREKALASRRKARQIQKPSLSPTLWSMRWILREDTIDE